MEATNRMELLDRVCDVYKDGLDRHTDFVVRVNGGQTTCFAHVRDTAAKTVRHYLNHTRPVLWSAIETLYEANPEACPWLVAELLTTPMIHLLDHTINQLRGRGQDHFVAHERRDDGAPLPDDFVFDVEHELSGYWRDFIDDKPDCGICVDGVWTTVRMRVRQIGHNVVARRLRENEPSSIMDAVRVLYNATPSTPADTVALLLVDTMEQLAQTTYDELVSLRIE